MLTSSRSPGPNGPDPVDVYVGKRMESRRKLLKISQEQLASMIDVSFQQVGKYGAGSNRVSASRLWKIARALGVKVEYFFEGLPTNADANVVDPMNTPDAVDLVSNFFMTPPTFQKHLLALIKDSAPRRLTSAAE